MIQLESPALEKTQKISCLVMFCKVTMVKLEFKFLSASKQHWEIDFPFHIQGLLIGIPFS